MSNLRVVVQHATNIGPLSKGPKRGGSKTEPLTKLKRQLSSGRMSQMLRLIAPHIAAFRSEQCAELRHSRRSLIVTGWLMRRPSMLVVWVWLSLGLSAGCQVASKPNAAVRTELHSNSPSTPQSADEQILLAELIETPPFDTQMQSRFNPSATYDHYQFPTLACDGMNRVLIVDREAEVAWLSEAGGIAGHLSSSYGPWRLDEPVLATLLTQLERQQQLEREEYARHKREVAEQAEAERQRRPWWQLSSGRIR